jgi:hypothetical protein
MRKLYWISIVGCWALMLAGRWDASLTASLFAILALALDERLPPQGEHRHVPDLVVHRLRRDD